MKINFEKTPKFTADFETCTWLDNETYVWAWATYNIDNKNFTYGNNIADFIEFCKYYHNPIIYMHNLKFDGEFIIYYLNTHGYKYIKDKKDRKNYTYTTLINNQGMFYTIEVYFRVGNQQTKKVTFVDSLKIIPFSVKDIAERYGMNISKLDLDYNKKREKGHKLTLKEIKYIRNDVEIVARALKHNFDNGLTKNTLSANALNEFIKTIKRDVYEYIFPQLPYDIDKDIRQAYKGGINYLNPEYKGKELKNGTTIDCNSLYPYVMRTKPMPYGEPVFFKGQYVYDKNYPLYVQQIYCKFKIKKNKIPTIMKKGVGLYAGNKYLLEHEGNGMCLTLTSVDLKRFFENYDVINPVYLSGWKFKSMNGIFDKYIDTWIQIKNFATEKNIPALRQTAKLMLNALYGKLATSQDEQSKQSYVDENGVVKYKLNDAGKKTGGYIPVGAFITAYAREETINVCQQVIDYSIKKYGKNLYCYADTDSCHCLLSAEELKEFINIDPVELGAWKIEGEFIKAKFIKQKCYIEKLKDKSIKIICSGMPKECFEKIEWDKFKEGFTCTGKLAYKHVKGGVKLIEETYTIKKEDFKKELKKF